MEKSSFFNSVSGDRKYSAEDWAAYFSSFISNGVFLSPSTSLQVMASVGMNITVKAGSGFTNGYFYRNTTDLIKTLSVADGVYNRIDRIVKRWSLVNRNITVQVLEGAAATVPTAPALTRYEEALADIYIPAGATSIVQSNITDRRADSKLCGIVTSALQQIDLTSFIAQFNAWMDENEAAFDEWFDNIQAQLSGDVAGNLQNQINNLKRLQFIDTVVEPDAFLVDDTYADFPFRAAVALDGVLATMTPEVVLGVSEAMSGEYAPVAETYTGGVYIYASSKPQAAITIPTIICWKAVT